MSDDPSTDRHRKPARQIDLSTALGALLAIGVTGAGATGLTASSVSAELRETRAIIVGRLDRIDERQADQSARVADLERRVRELELGRAAAPR